MIHKAALDFTSYAKAILATRGDLGEVVAAGQQWPDISPNAMAILRAARLAGTTTSTVWAALLVPYVEAEAGFIASLQHSGVFDRLLHEMRRVPMTGLVVISSVALAAGEVAEGTPKPVQSLSFTGDGVQRLKVAIQVVISAELARLASPAAMQLIWEELRAATVSGSDQAFLRAILTGLTPIAGSADVSADIAAALAAVSTGGGSKLYWVLPGELAKSLSSTVDSDGRQVYEMAPSGGFLNGIPALVTDVLNADQAVLLDASRIACGSDLLMLSSTTQASMAMDDQPAAGQQVVSLWQQNLVGLRGERSLAVKAAPGAVAALSAVAWGAPKP